MKKPMLLFNTFEDGSYAHLDLIYLILFSMCGKIKKTLTNENKLTPAHPRMCKELYPSLRYHQVDNRFFIYTL